MAMVRALHEGLGISAEALINAAAPPDDDPEGSATQWERFPLNEMIARGWIESRRARTWTQLDVAAGLVSAVAPPLIVAVASFIPAHRATRFNNAGLRSA